MGRRKFRSNAKCSRVGCTDNAITREFHDGKWHALCKSCWQMHMDQKDFPELKGEQPADRKTLAAGS